MEQEIGIPMIDLGLIGLDKADVSDEDLKKLGAQLKDAFITRGACYIYNHGIDGDLVERLMAASRDFFCQSVDEKSLLVNVKGTFSGWIGMEKEALNPERPGDLKEAFSCHPVDYPDKWPDVKDFRQSANTLFGRCTALVSRLHDALSLSLNLERNFLRDAHKETGGPKNQSLLRTQYYPPLEPDTPIKPGQIRLGEHTDYGTLAIVFQDDIGGLEANVPGKGFVPVPPVPGTAVLQVGALMQRWTADLLMGTIHRVVIPEAELKKRKYRQSCVYFVQPDNDYVIKCTDGSNKYEPISSIDYVNYRFDATFKN